MSIANDMFSKKDKKILNYILFVVLFCFNLYLVLNHEYWRDETQAWLIAKDCKLTADSIFTITSYEGHPILWFLVLMPFAKLGISIEIMKYIALLFVTAALYILIFRIDMPLWIKAVMALSPTFVGFYVAPSRSYSLAALLLISITALYNKKNERPILFGILLALLLQTIVIMGGFVMACGVCWFIETILEFKREKRDVSWLIKSAAGMFITLFSAIFLLWEFRLTETDTAAGKTLLTVIQYLVKELNFGLQMLYGGYVLVAVLVAVICAGALFVYDKNSRAPIIIATVGILWQLYIYAFVYGTGNHRVLTWLYLAYFIIITTYLSQGRFYDYIASGKPLVLILVAAITLGAWNYSDAYLLMEDLDPDMYLSSGKEAAEAINQLPEDAVIFITSAGYDTPVVAQIDSRHTIYDPFTKDKASFVIRKPEYDYSVDYATFINTVTEMCPDADCVYVVLTTLVCHVDGFFEILDDDYDFIEEYYSSSKDCEFESYLIEKINLK